MNNSPTNKEPRRKQLFDFVKEIYQIWLAERPTQLAAALAYFGLFSFAPVIYIALSVAGLFFDKSAILDRFLTNIQNTLGPNVAQAIQGMLEKVSTVSAESSFLLSAISFVLLLLTASGVFFQLQFALNTVWKVQYSKERALQRTIRERLFSFLMVIGLGLLLVVGAMVSILFSWISSRSFLPGALPSLTFIGFILLATVIFGIMYKILPAVKLGWRDVWLGAATAAILVAVGGMVIIFFIKNTSLSSALEAAGSFIIILTGFYYFAQIFLLGAILSRIYTYRYGSLRPKPLEEVFLAAENKGDVE
jgi:membrane protein